MRQHDGQLTLSPSDLSAYLACRHKTTLEVEVVHGLRSKPHTRESLAQLLMEKGILHEERYLEHLRDQGSDVLEVELSRGPGAFEDAHVATVAAMRAGVDVIYQATFVREEWSGRSDFVVRVDEPSDLGSWSYEPYDAKLARSAKPDAVLQLAWYACEIGEIQGRLPECLHLVLGTSEVETFRPADVDAYLRVVQRRLRAHVTNSPETYPWPCEHCDRCDFAPVCRERNAQDDHLSRVASIRRDQISKLESADMSTLTGLAESDANLTVRRLAPAMMEKLQDQAALQLVRYRTGDLRFRLLVPEERRGLGLLPQPSAGDLFFDIEGDPFFEPAARLEFLFGILSRNEDGTTEYLPMWSHDRETERAAFETFVDLVCERRRVHPDMHVYHYAAYEPTTLARLIGEHAIREDEVDELLRGEVFVDLLQVVRQAVRIGIESYSLKDVELLFFTRNARVSSGNAAVIEFEHWLDDRDPSRLSGIAAYNEEDCLATLELRDWLLARIPDAEVEHGATIPFYSPRERVAIEGDEAADETEHLGNALLAVEGETSTRLLARLLDYHRREARPAYWWYYRRQQMTDEELADDGEALGLLEYDGAEPVPVVRSLEWTFTFPPQQHHFDEGYSGEDPREGGTDWKVSGVDNAAGTIRLRRGMGKRGEPLPTSLVRPPPIKTTGQRAALRRLARSVLSGDRRYPHLEQVLRSGSPLGGARVQRSTLDEQRQLLDELYDSYLVVQGPPGSGKTYRGARLITHLLRQGRRVGVTAQSHKVIHTLLDAVEEAAAEEELDFKGIKRGDHYQSAHITPSDELSDALDPEITLVAGTAWLFAREQLDGSLDTLVVDEAGQYSLADTLVCGTAAHRLVLLGDPLQLAQVTQGVHPDGSGSSVLEHLLGDHKTIPEDMGVFLEETRRMHPEICRFISETFYEGRLGSIPACSGRYTSDGVGVRSLAVPHEGNRVDSEDEAEAIARELERLLDHTFCDDATERPLRHSDFIVVAPYNAQVRLLRSRLPASVEVGTVDKFQGREAAVVFYSMASSSGENVPRGLDFLMSRNRLNVAVSRAQCLAYVVCSPALLEVDCKTVEHLRLANALCRFSEFAAVQA